MKGALVVGDGGSGPTTGGASPGETLVFGGGVRLVGVLFGTFAAAARRGRGGRSGVEARDQR
jgi:hypothetical protein